jgi:hypothetical protein
VISTGLAECPESGGVATALRGEVAAIPQHVRPSAQRGVVILRELGRRETSSC